MASEPAAPPPGGQGLPPDIPALPPGTLMGHYKLLKCVAAGGFGLTYIAWDQALKRNLAIKECFPAGLCFRREETGEIVPLKPDLEGAYQKTLEDMEREARTLASLNHERLVRIYDVFESQHSLFYAMPWLPGGSLADKIEAVRLGGAGGGCRPGAALALPVAGGLTVSAQQRNFPPGHQAGQHPL